MSRPIVNRGQKTQEGEANLNNNDGTNEQQQCGARRSLEARPQLLKGRRRRNQRAPCKRPSRIAQLTMVHPMTPSDPASDSESESQQIIGTFV